MEPTATHDDALTHDTEYKMSVVAPVLGVGTTDHVEPFHDSTNATVREPLKEEPTATHDDALTHDTEYKMSVEVPAFGLGTMTAASTVASAGTDARTEPATSDRTTAAKTT